MQISPLSEYAPIIRVASSDTLIAPNFIVVVDTEEEFDWRKGPDRNSIGVSHFSELHRFHQICVKYGVKPVYVVDYPVVSQIESSTVLKQWHSQNECVIGAHLHPWVNPPFTEELSISNMYPGNLPVDIEKQKLQILTQKIQEVFDVRPHIYKAGRYGFGPSTAMTISELGYTIDLSFSPSFDMRADGGGDHRFIPPTPFFINNGVADELFCIPGSGAVVGILPSLYSIGQKMEFIKMPGVLSRLGISDRIKLSPELYSYPDHKKIVKHLLACGVKTFSFTLHSSTVMPNGSPYAKSEKDVEDFLNKCDRFFEFFVSEIGGKPSTPDEIRALYK